MKLLVFVFFSLSAFEAQAASLSGCQITAEQTGAAASFLLPRFEQKIQALWDVEYPLMKIRMTRNLDHGNPKILYDIQGYLSNLVMLAQLCKDSVESTINYYRILEEIADVLNLAHPYLRRTLYGNREFLEWHCEEPRIANPNSEMMCQELASWKNQEYVGTSVEFINLLSRMVNTVVRIDPAKRTSAMRLLVSRYQRIVSYDHLYKWIEASTRSFYIPAGKRFNCRQSGYKKHYEIVRIKHERNQVLSNPPIIGESDFCYAVLDRDLVVITAAVEILAANSVAPSLVVLSPTVKNLLQSYSQMGRALVASRFTGESVKGFVRNSYYSTLRFDKGAFRDHPDTAWAGNESIAVYPPVETKAPVGKPDWDIGHSRRLVYVLDSLRKYQQPGEFPTRVDMTKVSHQLLATYNQDCVAPKFTNFMDGTNGWYRVGYDGIRGYEPYQLSSAWIVSGYSFWTPYGSAVRLISNALLKLVESTQTNTVQHRLSYFSVNPWATSPADPSRNSATMLKFYSSLIGVSEEPGSDAHCRGLW